MIGVPEEHWRLLYGPLFVAYAEYVQRLPASETGPDCEACSLLQHALHVVELALKIRRGYLLPPGKEPEAVANEQDVWTYAVVTGALLHDAGKALPGLCATLYGRDRSPAGVWNPWVEPITETGSAYYGFDLQHQGTRLSTEAVTPLLVAHVVPKDGLRWLGNHEDALAAWLGAISGHAIGAPVIADIVSEASERAAARTNPANALVAEPEVAAIVCPVAGTAAASGIPGAHTVESSPSEALDVDVQVLDANERVPTEPSHRSTESTADAGRDDPGEAFVQWLTAGLKSGSLPINSEKGHIHVVDAGLLLASPAVFRTFAGENWRDAQKRFLKRKLTAKAANGENVFYYLLQSERGQRTIKGMLIRDAEQKLALSLPNANPRLSPKPDSR